MRVVAAWVLLLVIIDAIRSWRHTYGLVEGALSWTPAVFETYVPPIIAYGLMFAVPPLLVTLLGLVRMQTWLATEAPKVLGASLGAAAGVRTGRGERLVTTSCRCRFARRSARQTSTSPTTSGGR